MTVASAKINSITATCTVTCPSCGLLCDDIVLENNKVLNTNCNKAITFFEQPLNGVTPLINGKPATLQQAVAHVAKLLKTSQQPLFAGLSTDVQGFRAIYNLAQKTNAPLQHMNAQSTARNMKVLQSTGWQTTTLTEVKNRADVIVCFGDIATHNPRFFERFVDCDSMFIKAKQREVIFIGKDFVDEHIDVKAAISPNTTPASLLACRAVDLAEITLVLRALVAGKKLKVAEVAGIKVSDLQTVADKLKAAKYAVLAWVAKDLDFPHAELTIQNITETVVILNNTTRAAGLPLGGSDGDTTANNANTWLSGLALNDVAVEHDLVVWVNSFNMDKEPPESNKPQIVLASTNFVGAATRRDANLNNSEGLSRRVAAPTEMRYAKTPDVFIPIATPGLDCSGTLFRVDSSVILPLKKIRENNLPTLSEVVCGIEALL
jgi:formylmethanofuran dehydrogenase subunit B